MSEKIRVLHVVGAMNRGGVETWLMHVLRHIDRERYQFDFLVTAAEPAAYDEEILTLGGRILRCRKPSMSPGYVCDFVAQVRAHGPYDVIHSHVHHFSGVNLALARMLRIPVRIAHSHNDTSRLDGRGSTVRKLYLRSTERMIALFATHKLAASGLAAASLFGEDWRNDPKCQLLYCGIDLTPFQHGATRPELRKELGIPQGAKVIGHVGRFSYQKNHAFILEIAQKMTEIAPEVVFLLVGDGELRPEIERQVRDAGLRDTVLFAGLRDDIPDLMMNAMDVFLLPSHHEGLPLVMIEAQAAGLPCVISDTVTPEADIVPGLVHRLSLMDSAMTWVETTTDVLKIPSCQFDGSLDEVSSSVFNIDSGVVALRCLYG